MISFNGSDFISSCIYLRTGLAKIIGLWAGLGVLGLDSMLADITTWLHFNHVKLHSTPPYFDQSSVPGARPVAIRHSCMVKALSPNALPSQIQHVFGSHVNYNDNRSKGDQILFGDSCIVSHRPNNSNYLQSQFLKFLRDSTFNSRMCFRIVFLISKQLACHFLYSITKSVPPPSIY